MNIFYLDTNPHIAAKYLCDKHVVKMCLETAQLLSTAHRELDGHECNPEVYKATHKNHPSAVWVRSSYQHYNWAYDHFLSISNEYSKRYGKQHLCWTKLGNILFDKPKNIPMDLYNDPPLCMPDEYKTSDAVTSYRKYYIGEKLHFAKWTNTNKPEWINNVYEKSSECR